MTRNSSYFAVTPRGFKCNNPASVLFKQELEDTREEERIAIELFVAKLRYKLNSLKAQRQKEAALEHLDFKQSDDASIMKIKGRPSESESDFVSQPPAEIDLLEGIPEDLRDAAAVDEWDPENDVQFLNQIKNYALSIDGHLDATVYAQFLYPLGYAQSYNRQKTILRRPLSISCAELVVRFGPFTSAQSVSRRDFQSNPLFTIRKSHR